MLGCAAPGVISNRHKSYFKETVGTYTCRVWVSRLVETSTNERPSIVVNDIDSFTDRYHQEKANILSVIENSKACTKVELKSFEDKFEVQNTAELTKRIKLMIEKAQDEDHTRNLVFLVIQKYPRHSPFALLGTAYFSVHFLTFGLLPFWSPATVDILMLSNIKNEEIDVKHLHSESTVWLWTPLYFSQNSISAKSIFHTQYDLLVQDAVGTSLYDSN